MGYGSTEALVEVMTASEEDGSGYESETASGVFTSVGAVARAEGDAVHVSKNLYDRRAYCRHLV